MPHCLATASSGSPHDAVSICLVALMAAYGTAQMQRRTRSTTRCSLHTRTRRLPSRVCKLAAQKSLYTWFTTKLL